jgi:hypothetical protein
MLEAEEFPFRDVHPCLLLWMCVLVGAKMEKKEEKEMQFLKSYYNALFCPFSNHTPYFIEDHVHHWNFLSFDCWSCRIGKWAQQMRGPIGQKHKAKSVYCSDFQLGSQQMIVTLQ